MLNPQNKPVVGTIIFILFYSWRNWGAEFKQTYPVHACSVASDSLWPQAPPFMKFPRHEYWSGLRFPTPGELPDPGVEPVSPTLKVDSLPLPAEPPGKQLIQYHTAIKVAETGSLSYSSLYSTACIMGWNIAS